MDSAGDRLNLAIKKRGYPTKAAFAEAVGEEPGTVRQQINRGTVPKDVADKYARRLRVPVDWLLYSKGPSPFLQAAKPQFGDSSPDSSASKGAPSSKIEDEADKEAPLGKKEGSEEVLTRQMISELSLLLGGAPADIVKDVYDYLKYKLDQSTEPPKGRKGNKFRP